MKKIAIALLASLPLSAMAASATSTLSDYVLMDRSGHITAPMTHFDVLVMKSLGVIRADGSIDQAAVQNNFRDYLLAKGPIPQPVSNKVPNQVPQLVPQVQPQATPQLTPQPVSQQSAQKTPGQVPHLVPQAVPQATPQLTPKLASQPSVQKTPGQVPHQVPQAVPQATPHLQPQLSTQKTPLQVPQQTPQATAQATPQLQPQLSAQPQAYSVSSAEVRQMQHDIDHNARQADRALDLGLSALAVAELPQATDGRSGLGLGLSSAHGQIGEALGFSSNFGEQNEYTINVSVSHAGSETAAGVGASYQW